MKRNSLNLLSVITILSALLAGCTGGYNGQLLGVQDRPGWNSVIPYGMVYIPSGTLHIGPSDQDVNFSLIQRSKSISIQGFYMDETEITNNEYRLKSSPSLSLSEVMIRSLMRLAVVSFSSSKGVSFMLSHRI